MNDLSRGFAGFFNAFGFMLRNGMGWMFAAPVLLWILFTLGLFQVGSAISGTAEAWAAQYLDLSLPPGDRAGWSGFWDDVKAFLNGARDVVVWIALKLAIFALVALVGKYVVLILLSPLMAYASERTAEVLTGTGTPFMVVRWLKEVLRGILMALRNGVLEVGINVVAWVLTLFVPVMAPLTAVGLWLVSCWFYGFSMFDYIHERQGLGIRASVRSARNRQGMVLANGIAFNLLMKVPLLGLVTAPLLGSVGAVLAMDRVRR